jgi:hypothetical protein
MALCIVFGMLVGYTVRVVSERAPLESDHASLLFATGEVLTLSLNLPEGSVQCKVTGIKNEFIGCALGDGPDRWFNLAFVTRMQQQTR